MIDFDAMVDNFLEREQWQKKAGRYYPSEIGTCIRKLWYSYKHPVTISGEARKIFHMGDMIHRFAADVMRSDKNPDIELLEEELSIKLNMENFIISGRIDDILLVKQKNEKVLVEVKSCKSVDALKKPGDQHVIQLQFYMHVSKINKGIVLYLEKNTLKSRVFEVEYSEQIAEDLIKRFSIFHKLLISNTLPKPEARGTWICDYCDYKNKYNNDKD